MSHVFRRLAVQLAGAPTKAVRHTPPIATITAGWIACAPVARRTFGSSLPRASNGYDDKARALNQKGLDEQEQEVKVREHQIKRPWLRDGADKPPVPKDGEPNSPSAKGT